MAVSGGVVLLLPAAGAVSRNEISQVVAVRAIATKRLGIKQSLDATIGTDPIGIVVIVPGRPTHVGVPAPAGKDHRGGTYSGGGNAERPSPTPKSSACH